MGLVRGMARTAVIAGTATAVSNRVSRRQANRWQQKEDAQAYESQQEYPPQPVYAPPPASAPPPPAAAPVDAGGDALASELARLADLQRQGVLTAEEFTAAKAKLLGL